MIVYMTDLYAFSFIRVIFRTGYSRGINLRTFQRYAGNPCIFGLYTTKQYIVVRHPKGYFSGAVAPLVTVSQKNLFYGLSARKCLTRYKRKRTLRKKSVNGYNFPI